MATEPDSESPEDIDAETVTRMYDSDKEESPSASIIECVAEATGRDPIELPPLYERVDPDAVNELLNDPSERPRATPHLSITFRYAGCDVTISGDGQTSATPVATDTSS